MDAFTRSRTDAAQGARRAPNEDHLREAFRPLALPALAAAMLVGATAARAARAELAARHATRVVHEDEPAQ